MDVERKIERAKIHLLRSHPFFGRIACDLDWIAKPGIGTAATDGKSIFWER